MRIIFGYLCTTTLAFAAAIDGAGSPPTFVDPLEGDAPATVIVNSTINLRWAVSNAEYCLYDGSSYPSGGVDGWPLNGVACMGSTSSCAQPHSNSLRLTKTGSYVFKLTCTQLGNPNTVSSQARVQVVATPTSQGVALSIVSSTPGPVKVGDTFSYTLKMTNRGSSAVSNPQATVNLPSSLQYVTAGCMGQAGNGRFIWMVGNSIPAGESRTCAVQTRVVSIPDEETIGIDAEADFSVAGTNLSVDSLQTIGTVRLARQQSRTTTGAPTTLDSVSPKLNADGNVVLFSSRQGALVTGDANSVGADIFLKDRRSGQTRLLSVNEGGAPLTGNNVAPALSLNGKAIAFIFQPGVGAAPEQSSSPKDALADGEAGQMCSAPPNGLFRPVCTTTAPGGGLLNGPSESPSLSASGNLLVFCSSASNQVPNDTNGFKDIFIKNQTTGETTLLSSLPDGTQGNGDSCESSISGNGRFVTFLTHAPNLGGTTSWQVVRRDLLTGTIQRISQTGSGVAGDADSGKAQISFDGHRVTFASRANNLVFGFNTSRRNVYVFNDGALAEAPASTMVPWQKSAFSASLLAESEPDDLGNGLFGMRGDGGAAPNGDADDPALSCNGSVVAFGTTATNVAPGDTAPIKDIVVADLDTGRVRRTVAPQSGVAPDGASTNPSLDCEGSTTAFDSVATNIAPQDGNSNADVFVQDDPLRIDPAAIQLDGAYSGNWYNPGQNGHGFLLEALGNGSFYVTWYVYVASTPLFLQGVATPTGNILNVQMYSSRSTAFPVGAGGATVQIWGNLKFTFTSSNDALVEWAPTLFGYTPGSMTLRRATSAALTQNDQAGGTLKACYSGIWFESARSGHGVDLEVNDFANGDRALTAYWYTYRPDGSPLWLIGIEKAFGGSVLMDLYQGSGPGTLFPPDFIPDEVTMSKWGTARFTFTGNNTLTMAYTPSVPGYTAGTVTLDRLTVLRNRQCQE